MAKPSNTEQFPEEGTPEYEAFINAQSASTEVATTEERSVTIVAPDGTQTAVSLASLKELSSADLLAMFPAGEASAVLGTDQYGPILEDKNLLCGVPFVIVHWTENKGDFGSFVTMLVITAKDERYIVNDGSTGIRDQLRTLAKENPANGMIACRHGFKRSDYTYTDPKTQEQRPASTFYIDTKL